MAVKIRLSRIGKKHVPFFRIVAVDSRKKRDGEFLENLGTYDVTKGVFIQFHQDRINDWIAKGAIVTDPVKKLNREYSLKNVDASVAPKKAAVAKKVLKKVDVAAEVAKDSVK